MNLQERLENLLVTEESSLIVNLKNNGTKTYYENDPLFKSLWGAGGTTNDQWENFLVAAHEQGLDIVYKDEPNKHETGKSGKKFIIKVKK